MSVVNRGKAEHYHWGDGADGWQLLKSDALSVIEERLPPGMCEQRHFHTWSQQFFYVLEGRATFELDGEVFELGSGDGLHVPAQTPHQLFNRSEQDLRFLVMSQPKSHGDRTNL